MIKLNYREYCDKVYACWMGKSIGGTLGAPYEGTHEYLSLEGFRTDEPESVPNDDLDLQLIWLQAVEFSGVKNINAYSLGEYWLAYVTPYWSEYGISKNNMRSGLPPAVAGDFANVWKHSNGAWIRTEIWATLAPACPDLAAKYAVEDAKVDHGTGEGTIAAAFVAALESAAFVISDRKELIALALGRIPENSRTARTVRLAAACHEKKMPVREARDAIIAENADIGDGWFQAPSNVGFVVLGLLYGEGDFKKSMLVAVNCGDDTDCTGATIGALLGILYGKKGLPRDWCRHVGDKIVTACINLGISWLPITSCKQLTERIARLAPAMLAENNARAVIYGGKTEIGGEDAQMLQTSSFRDSFSVLRPYSFSMPFAFFTAEIIYYEEPVLVSGGETHFALKLHNNVKAYGNQPYDLNVRIIAPDCVETDRAEFCVRLPHWTQLTQDCATREIDIVVRSKGELPPLIRIIVEITAAGHYTAGYVPVVLLNRI